MLYFSPVAFFQCMIDFNFTKVVFSQGLKPRVKILSLVFMGEIKIYLKRRLKKSNFCFLYAFKLQQFSLFQCSKMATKKHLCPDG